MQLMTSDTTIAVSRRSANWSISPLPRFGSRCPHTPSNAAKSRALTTLERFRFAARELDRHERVLDDAATSLEPPTELPERSVLPQHDRVGEPSGHVGWQELLDVRCSTALAPQSVALRRRRYAVAKPATSALRTMLRSCGVSLGYSPDTVTAHVTPSGWTSTIACVFWIVPVWPKPSV